MSGYCGAAPGHPFHGPYHDSEYGVPSRDDAVLFERMVLEINQAGLSWLTILKKRDAFRAAFHGFDVGRVAAFDDEDRARLMADAGIIRNRLKIDAAIANAGIVREIIGEYGSFAAWIDRHHPRAKADWVTLFRKQFRFMGGEIVGEFLMSLGYLEGAHAPSCERYHAIMALSPPWAARRG